jgi:hypothetical protein
MISEIERAKLIMIIECERVLPDSFKQNQKYFPKFILNRTQIDEATGDNKSAQQWQGLVKELKNDHQRVADKLNKEVSMKMSKISKEMLQMREDLEETEKTLKQSIEQNQRMLESILKHMHAANGMNMINNAVQEENQKTKVVEKEGATSDQSDREMLRLIIEKLSAIEFDIQDSKN